MIASVKWTEGLAFEASANGHTFVIDSEEAFGGTNRGPRPKALTLISLGGCTGMDVVSILGKMHLMSRVDYFEVITDAVIEEELPRAIKRVVIDYVFKGKDLPIDKLQHAIELSIDKYCGVLATLRCSVEISHRLIINGLVIE
ncbi:MAG: OsmC family protein [Candidatus Omnitrophota bacterium]